MAADNKIEFVLQTGRLFELMTEVLGPIEGSDKFEFDKLHSEWKSVSRAWIGEVRREVLTELKERLAQFEEELKM